MGRSKKVWRNGGAEDNYVLRLIRNGKITKNTKPVKLRKINPDIFKNI